MQNTDHQTKNQRQKRIAKRLFFVSFFCLILVSGYAYFFSLENEEAIQKRFDTQLQRQKQDLDFFKEQFAVYSNPFNIDHDKAFRKQVYINERLVYWSDDSLFPEIDFVEKDQSYIENLIGHGIIMVETIGTSNNIYVISYLPISKEYPTKNQFLQAQLNKHIFINKARVTHKPSETSLQLNGQSILYYELSERLSKRAVYLIFILLIFCCSFGTWWISASLFKYRLLLVGALIICSKLLIEEVVMRMGSISIFEPINYTSPYFGKSAGQLFLSSLTFLSFVFLTRKFLIQRLSKLRPTGAAILLSVSSLLYIHTYVSLILDIIENSQIKLDITSSIVFTDVKLVLLGAVILSMLAVLLLLRLNLGVLKKVHLKPLIVSLVLLMSIYLIAFPNLVYAVLPAVLASLVIVIFINNVLLDVKLNFNFFTSVLLITAGFACSTAVVIYQQSEKDDLISKQKFANTLLIHNDFTAELLLNSALSRISKDGYIRSRFLSTKLSSDLIESKIRNEYLSPYFNKYALDIFLATSESSGLYNSNQLNFTINDSLQRAPTAFQDIYLITSRKSDVPDKYMAEVPFRSIGGDLGKLIMVFSLKKYIPKSIYPQLLNNQSLSNDVDFDYAVFKDKKMIYKQGKHPFETNINFQFFENSALFEEGVEFSGFAYYGVKTSDERVIIISSPLYSLQKILQNGSFYFSLFLLIWLLILLIYITTNRLKLSLSSKIQISLSISIFIPMIVVAIALLSTLSTSYKSEIDRNFSKRSFNMAESLIELTEKYLSGQINQAEYANQIVANAEITQSDLNIYDVNGRLLVSSQPQIFNKSLLSGLIEPEAINALKYGNEQGIVLDRSIGVTEFKSSYTPIRSYRDGKLLAFLSMPYFDSKNHLRNQQIEVFNNITFIFTLIFLIAYFAENIFVGQLIQPLKRIAEKLARTKFEETNERLDYDADDEIGQLVTEYNSMIGKLEVSKLALTESQKESAWKEIARQVAHEIKNPLTPMRLRIQQLLRSSDLEENHKNVLNSLIDQIDSLSTIADSFSAFATMPAPKNELFEIKEVIQSALEVYQTHEVIIELRSIDKEVFVFSDPKLFSRVMTNIILNAFQSVKNKKPHIVVSIGTTGKSVLISISDNGEGMSDETKKNVFKPYFSTKSTGSGIGLAVAKKGIENAGGTIWFESKELEGTTFYIKLPSQ